MYTWWWKMGGNVYMEMHVYKKKHPLPEAKDGLKFYNTFYAPP